MDAARSSPPSAETPHPLADVQMMMVCSDGRERSRDDYGKLLAATGFRLARVFPSATVDVIEGVAV